MKKSIRLFVAAWTLALCGCASERLLIDNSKPTIEIDRWGKVTFRGETLAPGTIAKAVKKSGIPKDAEIKVLVPQNGDRLLMSGVYDELRRAGYTRAVFIKHRTTASSVQKYNGAPLQFPPQGK